MVSPHMANLAVMLAKEGYSVTFVAQEQISAERAMQGWVAPTMEGVALQIVGNISEIVELVKSAPKTSVHICQGIRSNGYVGVTQKALKQHGLKQWIIMETVDDRGLIGFIKRVSYTWLFQRKKKSLDGVLANGYRTQAWIMSRGVDERKVFQFAYFLPWDNPARTRREPGPFRIGFAGQLITRKRVDFLIEAVSKVKDADFELHIVGTGAGEEQLRSVGQKKLGERIKWIGKMPISQMPNYMRQLDCLVLPSSHDGWGAVASEALIQGTPVICSDACGVAGVVKESGVGGVFMADSNVQLTRLLSEQIHRGVINETQRQSVAEWAAAIGGMAGAKYLIEILEYVKSTQPEKPIPPWVKNRQLGDNFASRRYYA